MDTADLSTTTVEPAADRDEPPAPNIEVVRGLRELADFLEAHPELAEVRIVAWISDSRFFNDEAKAAARGELTALARALGPRATERQIGDTVRISGEFGPINLHAEASVHDLRGGPPPTPKYEPIIPARDGGEAQ